MPFQPFVFIYIKVQEKGTRFVKIVCLPLSKLQFLVEDWEVPICVWEWETDANKVQQQNY